MGKRKIGEIYNKPIIEGDINLKTPNEIHKSELSGGGGNSSGEVKEWYYKFNTDKLLEDFSDNPANAVMIVGFFSFYIHEQSIDDRKKGNIESQIAFNVDSFTKNTLESLKAGKLVNNIPFFGIFGDGTGNYPTYVYGDYYNRVYAMYSNFDKNATIEQTKEMLDHYITEISKEEYEALIEIPNVIIGKD